MVWDYDEYDFRGDSGEKSENGSDKSDPFKGFAVAGPIWKRYWRPYPSKSMCGGVSRRFIRGFGSVCSVGLHGYFAFRYRNDILVVSHSCHECHFSFDFRNWILLLAVDVQSC